MSENATMAQQAPAVVLLSRLLSPSDLGHTVTAEVRDLARQALGMKAVESNVQFLASRAAAMTDWFDAWCLDRAGCVFGPELVASWLVQLLSGQPYMPGPEIDEDAVQARELAKELQGQLDLVQAMALGVVTLQQRAAASWQLAEAYRLQAPAASVETVPAAEAQDATDRHARLLWDLHRNGVMSEQRCAESLDVDLVEMRGIFNQFAMADSQKCSVEPQEAGGDAVAATDFQTLLFQGRYTRPDGMRLLLEDLDTMVVQMATMRDQAQRALASGVLGEPVQARRDPGFVIPLGIPSAEWAGSEFSSAVSLVSGGQRIAEQRACEDAGSP